jgi:hypothetical protein
MFDDVDLLADHYLHGLLSFEANQQFEKKLETDPAYQSALEAARRRLMALELARPESPAAEAVAGRVMNDVVTLAAADGRRSGRRKRVMRWVAGGVAASILFLVSLHVHYANLAANPIDLEVRGQDKLIAGSEASLRVRVTEHGSPMANVPVEIGLENSAGESVELTRFNTDGNGSASPKFNLPDWADGEYRLKVVAHTPGSPERIEHAVKLRRSARVLLATDKPVYQPGQTIRMRTIALRTYDSRPLANQPAVLTITDPKTNVVFKRTGQVSKFGIFAADCELADEVNEGAYRIVSRVGDTESSLTVDVRHYVLPKFKIDVAFDKPYFKFDEPIHGLVRAFYFHGQPVNGEAMISIEGERPQTVRIERGKAAFRFDPVHVPEKDPTALLRLNVQVIDTAGQKHEKPAIVSVARQDLTISTVPQSGSLTTGFATNLLFRVQTPDGKPVRATLISPFFDQPLSTDESGWATLPYMPGDSDLNETVIARTNDGRVGSQQIRLRVNRPTDGRVLTTDGTHYTGGQTMTVIALGRDGLLFVDFFRGGQTVRTESLTIENGRGELAFDLPAEWEGEIEIRSYAPGGAMHSSPPCRVTVTPAQQVNVVGGVRRPVALGLPALAGGISALDGVPIRPGEKGRLSLAMRDKSGRPVAGAISLTAVDEAVFSVMANAERSLQREKDIVPAFELPYLSDDAPQSRDRPDTQAFSLYETTMPEKIKVVEAEQARGHLRTLLGWTVLILLGFGYVCYRVWEEAPKSVSMAALFLVPGLPSATLIAGCERAKMEPEFARQEAGAQPKSATTQDAENWLRTAVNHRANGLEVDPVPRIRRYFPETMLWQPELISDDNGRIDFDFDFADSITSWRFAASAITADGRLGGWQQDVPVFQPFFVDVNLPVALTRNDIVTVPVVVSNYLKGRQTVRVELPDADWYTRTGDATREITLNDGEVKAIEFRVKVSQAGTHVLLISARAGNFGDAVQRDVIVNADGQRIETVSNGVLDRPAPIPIDLPDDTIDGSIKATLKLYPSGFSQLVEGLEGIFQAPHGCFEQTSSTTYPNVLALDYLKKSGKANRQVEEQARRFVHLGYQRLLTFEVNGGGFDWYGRGPANKALTAYGLMEFRDMTKVAEVDSNLIARTRNWLLKQRKPDGSWEPDWDPSHRRDGNLATLRATAYIAWAAFQGTDRGDAGPTVRFLNETSPERIDDPYVLALVCNALLAIGDEADPYLRRLEQTKQQSDDGKQIWWSVGRGNRTTFHGAGQSGDVEATALAVLAFSQSKTRPGLANGALRWITAQRSSHGTWGSTQATVLALKALLANTAPPTEERRFAVALNGERIKSWTVPADEAEVLQQLDLTRYVKAGHQNLEVRELTGGNTPYQVAVRHHVPRASQPKQAASFGLTLGFDRDTVPVGDLVRVTASVWNRGKETSQMVMLELPIPPGFELIDDLNKLVGDRDIDRVEPQAMKAVLYIRAMEPEKVREITYRLRAISAGKVTVPAARVYEYYDPNWQAVSQVRVVEAIGK